MGFFICLFVCFFLFLAWGILVPWPGIKPVSPAVEVQSSNYWITREFPVLQVVLVVKNSPASAGDISDPGSIPVLGRSPGEGNGNPLQYSCLENPMDRGAWWAIAHGVTKSQTWSYLACKKKRTQYPQSFTNVYSVIWCVFKVKFYSKKSSSSLNETNYIALTKVFFHVCVWN